MVSSTTSSSTARVRRGPGRPAGRPAGAPTITDREGILDAAERAIRSAGPSVSLEAIAAEAGVTKPILYQHVGNKDAIVDALAERHLARTRLAIDAAVATATSPRQGWHLMVEAFLGVVDEHRDLFLFLTSGGTADSWLQRSLHLADRSAEPLIEALAAQRRADGADPAVATSWAYGIVGMMHYIALWWIRDPGVTIQQVADQITELMFSGLARRRPTPS